MLEIRPNKPPIHFTLTEHSETSQSLERAGKFFTTVNNYLETNPHSRIIIVKEDASGNVLHSRPIFEQTMAGIPFSKAWGAARLMTEIPQHSPSQIDIEQYVRNTINTDTYSEFAIDQLNSVVTRHPRRVGVLCEGNDEDVLVLMKKARSVFIEFEKDYFDLVRVGKIDSALLLYKRFVQKLFESDHERDVAMANLILQYVAEFKPEAVFVLFGTSHTAISHPLSKMGFSITREFPEKTDEGVFVNPPPDHMARELRFKTEFKPESTDWVKSFLRCVHYLYLSRHIGEQEAAAITAHLYRNTSNQEVLKQYKILKRIGIEKFLQTEGNAILQGSLSGKPKNCTVV